MENSVLGGRGWRGKGRIARKARGIGEEEGRRDEETEKGGGERKIKTR